MAVIGIAISMIAAVAALGGAGEGAIGQTAPADSPSSSGKCADLKVRREWRELEASEQTAFTNAVKCLKAKPSGITGISSPSRFDDAAYVHQKAGGVAHGNRDFLPWHRNYLKLYERTLQVECGYTGTLPYWDWSVDSQRPEKSGIFYPGAFGSDGDRSDSCVRSGPFAGWKVTFGQPGCLSRSFDLQGSLFSPEAVQFIISRSGGYDNFRDALEFGPHGGLHVGIGGAMSNLGSAANDPIFYMHHANVDRLFSNWIDEQDDSEKLFNKELETSKVLNMFGWKVEGEKPMTISETYSTDSDRLCYIYSDSIRLDEPIVKRQLPGSSSNPGPISCPKPLADKMIAQMNLTSEQIAKIRRKEAMICKFIGFVNDKEHVSLSSRAADSSKHNWVARSPREGIASKQRLRKLVEDYEAENPEPFE